MHYLLKTLMMTILIPMLFACQPTATVGEPQVTLSTEETNMTPLIPTDEATAKMVTLVTQNLAQKLGIPVEQIVLSEVRPVVWRDAGLGCPKPGVDYIQVETPGYTIRLEAAGKTYNYHTDQTKRFVLCNK